MFIDISCKTDTDTDSVATKAADTKGDDDQPKKYKNANSGKYFIFEWNYLNYCENYVYNS